MISGNTPARRVPRHHGQLVVHEYPLIKNMPQVRTIVDPSGNAMAGMTRTDLLLCFDVENSAMSTTAVGNTRPMENPTRHLEKSRVYFPCEKADKILIGTKMAP
mmetsp:Transcript_15033/g.50797  ORF Transcript_15033/g.50797 Transcript_15033/m.50797 type:complete len:104 (+) Transcript_15033:945-1256(+)